MSRSFVSCTLIVLLSGLGCVAQQPGISLQESKGLQESIARLEEQVARLGEHMKTAQQEKAHASEERDTGAAKMRAALADQERAWKDRQSEQERMIADLKDAMARQREQMAAEQAKARQQLEQELRQRAEASAQERERKVRDETEHLRAELATLREHAGARDGDRARLIEMLAGERKQIAQLREAIASELGHMERGAADAERLRDENEQLRGRVAALERELARSRQERATAPAQQPMPQPSAPPGTIVINNEDGEIHFHFHGAAPNVVMPRRADEAAPGPAGPAGPSGPPRARPRTPPRVDAPVETKDRDDGTDEKRLNQARPAPVSSFVQALLASF